MFWLGAHASVLVDGEFTPPEPTSEPTTEPIEDLAAEALPPAPRSPRDAARIARRAARRVAAESAMAILTRLPFEATLALAEDFNAGQPRADRIAVGIENGCASPATTLTPERHLRSTAAPLRVTSPAGRLTRAGLSPFALSPPATERRRSWCRAAAWRWPPSAPL